MANFFVKPAATGVGGYNALTAHKSMWSTTALSMGGYTYEPDAPNLAPGEIRKSFIAPGILKYAKVIEQGIGMVVKGEASVEIYDAGGIDNIGSNLGSTFSIGYWGGGDFLIYDMSITNIQPEGWQVTVKGISKGIVGGYHYIDIAASDSLNGKTFGTGMRTWFSDKFGDHDEFTVGFALIVDSIISDPIKDQDLLVEGHSLADHVEGLILAEYNIENMTVNELLGGVTGESYGMYFSAYQMLGIPILPDANLPVWKAGSGIIGMKMYGLPNWADSQDNLIASGICGWIRFDILMDLLETHVLKNSDDVTDIDWSTYSDVSLPDSKYWAAHDPLNNIMWNNGSVPTWDVNWEQKKFIHTSTTNAGKKSEKTTESSYAVDLSGSWFKYSWPWASMTGLQTVYISHALIRSIQTQIALPNNQIDEDIPIDRRALGTFPLGKFMDKLLDVIRTSTGGVLDFTMDQVEGDSSTIYLVSRKVPKFTKPGSMAIPLRSRNESYYGVRDVKVSANVPKSIAARIFSGTAENTGLNKSVVGSKTVDDPSYNVNDIHAAMSLEGGLNQNMSDNILHGLNLMGAKEIQDNIAVQDPPALPSEISATIDLNTDISFAQTVRISPSPKMFGGSSTIWAITEVSHKVEGTDGVTEFKAIAKQTGN